MGIVVATETVSTPSSNYALTSGQDSVFICGKVGETDLSVKVLPA
jgi:hypothetical protein